MKIQSKFTPRMCSVVIFVILFLACPLINKERANLSICPIIVIFQSLWGNGFHIRRDKNWKKGTNNIFIPNQLMIGWAHEAKFQPQQQQQLYECSFYFILIPVLNNLSFGAIQRLVKLRILYISHFSIYKYSTSNQTESAPVKHWT